MFKIIILLVLAFQTLPSQARIIDDFMFSVKDGMTHYQVKKERNFFYYEGQNFFRKFEIKKCNEVLIKNFLDKNFRLKNKNNLVLPKKYSGILYTSKNESLNYASDSYYGKFLRDFPKEIFLLVFKEKALCSKQ